MEDQFIQEFQDRFHTVPERVFFCPGRVNLIGEHIDYNGGQVMPCAITKGTWLAVARNTRKELHFQAMDYPEKASLRLQTSFTRTGPEWFNYPLGIINHFLAEGRTLSGLDMLFHGNLPVGAGLSSSASIEVLTAFALNALYGYGLNPDELALLSKKVENEFIGVSCGIMDQFAVAMGKKDRAILLNCDTLAHEYLPFTTGAYDLVIINSKKHRSLAESKYNERFIECGMALKKLKQKLDAGHLCEISLAEFEMHRHLLADPVLEKRAFHVISEHARVSDAVVALQTGDLAVFGKLMYASHRSLRENYEVSGKELDAIVDFCKNYPGCIGARMTGAGFGGCVIALVQKGNFEDFSLQLAASYESLAGYPPESFISAAGDGAREIKL